MSTIQRYAPPQNKKSGNLVRFVWIKRWDPYTVYTNYMKNTALPSCPQSGAGRADILMKQKSRQDALYYFAFEEVFFAEEPELLSTSLPVFSTDVGSALTLSGFSPS